MKEFFYFKNLSFDFQSILMKILLQYLLIVCLSSCAQKIELKKSISLPQKISETSGLLWDGKDLITHNDSGGKAELYVISEKDGHIKRTIKITNAKNVDWEDLAQDDEYIYIADTGNNSGNRTDLTIHKIKKEDFYGSDKVKSEKIKFKYQNQTINASSNQKNNFDCEAITIYNHQLLLLTKNKNDGWTQLYSLPTEKGEYVITPINSLNVNCLITSLDYNRDCDLFMATAYNAKQESFVLIFNDLLNVESKYDKITLTSTLNYSNQIESVAFKNKNEIYITREYSNKKVKGTRYKHKEKLFLFKVKP